jgi:uncharacterized protein (DUF433 family)
VPRAKVNKGGPFSIRLSRSTDQFVDDEARRTRRSKSAVVEALTEEAARMRRFPGIGFRDEDPRREAWVIGTALDVWEIVEAFRDFGSIEEMVAGSELSEREIRLALAYAEQYPDELEEKLRENRRPLDELKQLYPFLRIQEDEPRG